MMSHRQGLKSTSRLVSDLCQAILRKIHRYTDKEGGGVLNPHHPVTLFVWMLFFLSFGCNKSLPPLKA